MLHFFLNLSLVLYFAASVVLLFYGLNCYVMLFLFTRKLRQTRERQQRAVEAWNPEQLPKITTQLPLYNEFNVAERAIRAIAAFDYPRELHQIQVLDDSTDETRERVDEIAAELRKNGVWIDVLRREKRKGYKAGALGDAMPAAHGEFIAIFDSDFVPAPDFLMRMLPHLTDKNTGLAQARWGHLNRDESLLTRTQSMGIDGHFTIEQTARSTNHLFLNFNGTAGIWRRAAIEDAGGWMADTLTEDLDLSYRAQLKGWHLEYVPDVVVPAELPETYGAFKSQQFRWAKGSIQTAIKLFPEVWRSKRPLFSKVQSVFHLYHYIAHPLMLVVALLALPAMQSLQGSNQGVWLLLFSIPLIFATCGPVVLYTISQHHLYPQDWKKRVLLLPALMGVGFGICISNSRAVMEAILGIKSGFIRTPKRGCSSAITYRVSAEIVPWLEVAAGIYCFVTLLIFIYAGNYGIIPFFSLYAAGFTWVGASSLREQFSNP